MANATVPVNMLAVIVVGHRVSPSIARLAKPSLRGKVKPKLWSGHERAQLGKPAEALSWPPTKLIVVSWANLLTFQRKEGVAT